MDLRFPVEEMVRKRYSVRNYQEKEIQSQDREALESFVGALENPFGQEVDYLYLDVTKGERGAKTGTYGVIKGARHYIGATISRDPLALLSLGYELETLMLYLAGMGIGTCWLGGTFHRKGFAKAMQAGGDVLFPVVIPYGYPAPQKHLLELSMRRLVSADRRKNWNQLFFKETFDCPLSKEEAGDLAFPLEMIRLGPSASNKQPWRILVTKEACHFYQFKTPGYSDALPYDIQRIDMGIAAAHFQLAAKEKGLAGVWNTHMDPGIAIPKNMEYAVSWIREQNVELV